MLVLMNFSVNSDFEFLLVSLLTKDDTAGWLF